MEGTEGLLRPLSVTYFLSFLHDPIDKDPDEGGVEVGIDVSNLGQ